jgi:hypothetical protein
LRFKEYGSLVRAPLLTWRRGCSYVSNT